MIEFITKRVSNKIIFSMFILMTLSSLAVLFSTVTKVSEYNVKSTKNNLEMLNASIFQSLRNAMNIGDPAQIKAAEDEARSIKGVHNLFIAKSEALIELYSPETKMTQDKDILKSFQSKQNQIIETQENNMHKLRMIKPMLASNDCLMCHANQQVGDVIGVMDLTFSLEDADLELDTITMNILITSTILGWITIGIVFFVVRKTTRPLEDLKKGFENLITSNDTNIKLDVDSKDEIGEVASLFNQYMHQVNEGLQKDEKVINETNDVLQKTANGFFVYKVHQNANNIHVEQMRKNLNHMIDHVKNTLDKINLTLRNYSQSKYDYKIDDRGIYGDLGSVTAGIKLVGNNTSEILSMILNTGDSLRASTHTLSSASSGLSTSSNTQAASLEETSAALEEITAAIKGNSQNTVKMANLAQDVTTSASKGEELAIQTSEAMGEIVTQVTSINEAIEVVDQISFQTNILSLNAAVEAATAGEAGKGFAVVAGEVRNLATRSAEAAKDIKTIVESAATKANEGKSVATHMIQGYHDLNTNIENTIQLINEVAKSSKEQQSAIIQINDAVVNLDRATQNNASVADQISKMSVSIEQMSSNLVNAASKASFLQETRKQVCDVDLIYEIANLKVDLFNYKDDVYARLADFNNNSVKQFSKLDVWLNEYKQKNSNIDSTLIKQLQEMNENLYNYLTELMNSSTSGVDNDTLNNIAKKVEIESMRIFGTLNKIKEAKCSNER